jgi:hypothetical protein
MGKHPITHSFVFLDAQPGQIFGLLTPRNFSFAQKGVFFLVIATCTKGSNAWTLLKAGFTFHEMWSLMKVFFPSPPFVPMPELNFRQKLPFYHPLY